MSDDVYSARRDAVRARLVERGLDAMLVSSLPNVRYLTGFTGSNGAVLVRAAGGDVLATDSRYTIQAGSQAPGVALAIGRNVTVLLAEQVAAAGVARLGYETHVVTVDAGDQVAATAPRAELTSVGQLVESFRAIKEDGEIDLLRRACGIADEALSALLAADGIRVGRSETDVARDLDSRMLALGAEAVSFETIVASGPNSAIPHHRPGSRTVKRGDFVKVDFGASYQGYHSDTTRTFCVGEPAGWQREVYELVAAAQRRGSEAVRVGADVKAVDAAARDLIAEAGHAEHFGHGLGHGVGLQIHEAPGLSQRSDGTLADRMSVTVEPGVYLEGSGGVRIEDTLIVRGQGGSELLTHASRDLVVL